MVKYDPIVYMASPDFGELKRVQINPDLLSRGSGEQVALQEATVYDFMPPIIGNRFRVDPTLRRGVHFFSDMGSFMMGEEAFQELATNELNAGNLVPALEAYKRGLHKAVGFAGAMAMMGDRALLNQAEIDRFNLPRRFGTIERGMISMIVGAGEDTKINLPEYADWVAGVRRLERDALNLNQQYFIGLPKHPENPDIKWTDPDFRDTTTVGDQAVGVRLRDTYAEMKKYKSAAWISGELGDEEAKAKYEELAKSEPQDPPGYEEILYRIQEREDRIRGYI